MDLAKGTRLDNWKDIAKYLGRSPRTAPRWAKRHGLPVYRVPGGKRTAVFAFTAEIDAWMLSRQENVLANSNRVDRPPVIPFQQLEGVSSSGAIETAQKSDLRNVSVSRPSLVRNKWLVFASAVFSIGIVWGIGVSVARSRAAVPVRPGGFVQLTDDGHVKYNLKTDGSTLYFNEIQGGREVLMSTTSRGGAVRLISTQFSNVFLQDVSHDGRSLLISSFEGIESERPLWVIPSIGGSPQRVGNATCHSASWSPDDDEIVCGSRNSIILMDVDGSNQRQLGSFSTAPEIFAWSPDGTRLRFLLPDFGTTSESAWELNLEKRPITASRAAERLPLAPDCCNQWGWTQDGKAFVYSSRAAVGVHNQIVKFPGGTLPGSPDTRVEIPVGIGRLDSIAAGKTDREIFVLIGASWRGVVQKIDPKRNTLETFLPGVSAIYVSFSPDGKSIAYINSVDGSLWRSEGDGSHSLRLSPPMMNAELPSWSPDGTEIAFTAAKPGKNWRIYLVKPNGGELREASGSDDNQGAPSWSPDGKSLVYANIECRDIRFCAVHRITLASRKVETLPGSTGFRTARWSPDGRYIAALQFESHELMLYEISTQQWKTLVGSVTGDDINWAHDSKSVYVDSPQAEKPIIERIRIKDGSRTTVGNLSIMQNMPGDASTWFGLAPDESLIVLHYFNATEVYSLDQTDR